jgi:hypothetical protein
LADQKALLEHSRNFLRARPGCDEAALRGELQEQFLLIEERARAAGASAGGLAGSEGGFAVIFHLFLLPVFAFRWLSYRQRLRGLNTQIDAVIGILRQEGVNLPTPAAPKAH